MRARLTCAALAWAGSAGLATGADTWLEVKTANFTVVTNAGEGGALRTAREFEQVRGAYAKLWPWARLSQGRPTLVLALKNRDTLRRWAPGYFERRGGIDVVSGEAYGAERIYLLLRTDARPDDQRVTPNYNLYRAYVGLLLATSFERRLPVWLDTGLAQVLGNTFVRDKEIRVGQPVPWEFRTFNENARLPLRQLLDTRAGSPLLGRDVDRHVFDAQCYMLVHYLLFGDRGAHASKLSRFQQLWQAGRSPDDALAESVGELAALEGQVKLHANSTILSYARLQLDAAIENERPSARTLAAAEVAALQAAVHVAFGRSEEAQAAIREARSADPASPASYDAEGLLADSDGDKPRATQAYARAVELGSASAHSHYRAAQLAWAASLDAPARTLIRQRLERAIELHPDHANAQSYLAEMLVQQGDGTAALAPAERAVALEPGESYHRVALARVLHKLGRIDEARRSAQLGVQLADDDAGRSNAERFLLFLSESARYAEERTSREAAQKQSSACQAGDAAACAQLLPGLERDCDANEATACRFLGWLYSQGGGLPRNAGKAAGYLQRGCAAGDKQACVDHAVAVARGEGLRADEPKGRAALEGLCDEGFLPACTQLAFLHAAKPGAAHQARAKALLKRACAGGEPAACTLADKIR